MRTIVILFVTLISAAQAYPQTVKLGLNFGVNYNTASFERSSLIWDVEKKFSPRLGLFAAYGAGGHFSFIAAVLYDGKAGQFSTSKRQENGRSLIQLISIPITVKLKMRKAFAGVSLPEVDMKSLLEQSSWLRKFRTISD